MLLGMVAFIGMWPMTLMPVFAKDVLHGGAHTQGFLMSASGVGALTAALFFASRRNAIGLERFASIAFILFGCANLVFSFSQNVALSLAAMAASGSGMMTIFIASNTIVQTVAQEDKRGRVMSIHAMATMGTVPFGSLIAGALASRLGAPHTVLISAACCLLGSFFFATKVPSLQSATSQVYAALGIIKEPAEAT
jgi:MFS family permease